MKTYSQPYTSTPLSAPNMDSGLNINLLPAEDKQELERQARVCRIKKKSALFYEGDSPKGLYILLSGKVKFLRLNPDGSEQIFFIYASGDVFGHRSILSSAKHLHTVVAMEECEFLFIEKDAFLAVIKRSPVLFDLFLNSIYRDFNTLTNMINVLTKKSIRERTAYFLLVLHEKYKLPGQVMDEAEIKVSRSDLASYIGASLENLIRTIKEFREKSYIRVEGKSIYIQDFKALQTLMDFRMLN